MSCTIYYNPSKTLCFSYTKFIVKGVLKPQYFATIFVMFASKPNEHELKFSFFFFYKFDNFRYYCLTIIAKLNFKKKLNFFFFESTILPVNNGKQFHSNGCLGSSLHDGFNF